MHAMAAMTKKNAKWAEQMIEQWYGHRPQGFQNYAGAFAYDEHGAAEAGAKSCAAGR